MKQPIQREHIRLNRIKGEEELDELVIRLFETMSKRIDDEFKYVHNTKV